MHCADLETGTLAQTQEHHRVKIHCCVGVVSELLNHSDSNRVAITLEVLTDFGFLPVLQNLYVY